MDEQGKFVISLLSGHIGGANELTEEVAAVTGAVPVITTATDVNHKFAVDVFAVKIIVKFVRWSWQKRQRRFWWTEKRLDSAAVFRWREQTGGTDPGRGGKTVDGNLHYHIGRGFAI